MIQKLKTLKDRLLNAEKQIATTKAIAASIRGTGDRSRRGGAPMFPAILAPAYTEGLTMPVLAALEGMFMDKEHAYIIMVCLSMAESAMQAAVGDSLPLLCWGCGEPHTYSICPNKIIINSKIYVLIPFVYNYTGVVFNTAPWGTTQNVCIRHCSRLS